MKSWVGSLAPDRLHAFHAVSPSVLLSLPVDSYERNANIPPKRILGRGMQYRGIAFDIKVSIERGEWIWVVHTPTPRHGKFKGTREQVMAVARHTIDAWCFRNPGNGDRGISVG